MRVSRYDEQQLDMTLIFASQLSSGTIVVLIGEDEHLFVVEMDRIASNRSLYA